jgi:hypothetical protein
MSRAISNLFFGEGKIVTMKFPKMPLMMEMMFEIE